MGLDPTKAVPAAAADPAADIPALNGTLEQLVARALEHSPERARLAAERDAARARLAAARAERAPTVTARANIGHVFGDTGGGGSRGDLPYSRLTLGVDLPLFEGGAIRAREQTLAAEVGLQEAALARAENGIKTDVVSAYTLFRAGAPTIQAAGDAVRAAEEARRLAQERYAVGRGTQLEVLRSLEDFAAARVRQAGAQHDQELAAHNLAFLTGVGAAAMPAREPDTPPDAGGTPDVRPPLSGNNSGTGERPADR
jgi:OMF family outer membrane factor